MTNCVVCGRELRGDEQVCPECGHPVEKASNTAEMAVVSAPLAEPDMEPQNGTTTAATGPSTNVVGRLTVRVITPTNGGQPREYVLDGRPIYIGRSPSCDIVLDGDQLTSRRHALLRYDSNRYVLVDLGSSNGTYINDTEVREATPLQDGDRVIVGEHELLYSTSAASPEASLPGIEWAPVPQQPPSETNPSLVAVAPLTSAESAVPFAVATVDYGQANGADAEGDVESATQEYPAVHMDPWPNDQWTNPEAQPPVVEETATDEPEFADAPPAQDAPATPYAPADSSYPQAGDVDLTAMHAQLAQLTAASETLARRMEEQGRLGERRKAAIQEAREQVASLLAQLDQTAGSSDEGGDSYSPDLNALIDVTRQAAENPQHLQYLTRLAEHAGEIADALQQEQQRPATASTPESIRQALEALRNQLESLG